MYTCREDKSLIKAQMQPAKRAVHALQIEMALKVGKPQIDNVAEQIGLVDQVDNDGYGKIVDEHLDGRSIKRLLKIREGPSEPNEVQLCEQTIGMSKFPYKEMVKEQFYHKITDDLHVFVLKSELNKLTNCRWFCDGTWTCTKDVKYIQTYIITVR